MSDAVPEGFVALPLGAGWAATFGQVHVNRATQCLGLILASKLSSKLPSDP